MQQQQMFNRFLSTPVARPAVGPSRKVVVGLLLLLALIAFEAFNFDTTRYALNSLLGQVSFMGASWATILAIAFCAIDFAGLARIFTPQRGADEPKAVWYLMGAWLLGATMNAVMTWWAVSLTLLSHDFGNEVLGREQILRYVPIFVAGLVLLTRILFIGAFSVAGEHVFDLAGTATEATRPAAASRPSQPRPAAQPTTSMPGMRQVIEDDDAPSQGPTQVRQSVPNNSRVNSRPPMPSGGMRPTAVPMQAKNRR